MKNLENIMKFISECEKLKSTIRYTNSGDKNLMESSAEHSWRLAFMVFMLGEEMNLDIDLFKSVKIALVHDLAESITGDLDATYADKNPHLKEEKKVNEEKAMNYYKNLIGGELGENIYSYWKEYESGITDEAKFVIALDKIEAMDKISVVERPFHRPDFLPFYADKQVKAYPQLRDVLHIVKKNLKLTYQKWGVEWKDEYDKY